jgi:transcriptional regulator with XRE-family HTH domain
MTRYFVSTVSQPDTFRCMTTLGTYVTQMREQLGLAQVDLAKKAEMTKGEINAIEKGRVAFPDADKRRRLAKALGVTHVDIVVACGELAPDEVAQGSSADPFPGDSDKSAVFRLLATASADDAKELLRMTRYVLKTDQSDQG